ncbi:hypothetical protein Tco_1002819 [Tanacetum coccineum]|uniref:Uncharacterized protein n=1 Tax=Tanacetum coccineum TaxID=301880 RepID=A0ABQ5F7C4_9ASTR
MMNSQKQKLKLDGSRNRYVCTNDEVPIMEFRKEGKLFMNGKIDQSADGLDANVGNQFRQNLGKMIGKAIKTRYKCIKQIRESVFQECSTETTKLRKSNAETGHIDANCSKHRTSLLRLTKPPVYDSQTEQLSTQL